RGFLEHRKKKIMEHCKDPYFDFQEMKPGVIFLEGRHAGCGDRPAMDYLGIIRSGENEILDTRYIYPSPQMPEKNRKVWKAIFMRMIHGPDA
ncbi:MAG: hypothetical protein KDK23_00435, partial [Leptospiraceae bacterium]|nr:hypothetical protein [Leptospiraceae bacterium]